MSTIYNFEVDFNHPVGVGHLLLFRPSFSISFDPPGTGHGTISHLRIEFAFYAGGAGASVLVDLLPGMSISSGYVREPIARCLSICNFPMEEGDRIRMINFALVNAIVAVDFDRLSGGVVHVNVYAHTIGIRPPNERRRDEWEGLYRFLTSGAEVNSLLAPDDDWTDIEFGGDDDHEFDIPADWIEGGEDKFMVPTDGWAIESLDSRKVSSSNSGSCTICLEEFMDGEEAMCMPCSHDFHGDCIKEWLNNSHYCPICRFEMPVAT